MRWAGREKRHVTGTNRASGKGKKIKSNKITTEITVVVVRHNGASGTKRVVDDPFDSENDDVITTESDVITSDEDDDEVDEITNHTQMLIK
nr:hypothetical protein [Tanacetum cinerariifolium]